MSSYEKIAAYLEAHPTPWRYVEAWPEDTIGYAHWADEGEGFDCRWKSDSIDAYEAVVDATGQVVLRSNDQEGLKSWLGGDVRALVDFVNLVGNDYEPPCGWPGVGYGPIEPVDQHELYEYGVTYTMRDGTEERIEWCEHTGDAELDRQIIRSRVANWRKAGQNPKVVRRRVGQVEQEPPEGWFEQRPRLRPVD